MRTPRRHRLLRPLQRGRCRAARRAPPLRSDREVRRGARQSEVPTRVAAVVPRTPGGRSANCEQLVSSAMRAGIWGARGASRHPGHALGRGGSSLPAPGSDARRVRRLGGARAQLGGSRVAAAAERLAGPAAARNAQRAQAGSGPSTRAVAECGGGARGVAAGAAAARDAGGCGHSAGSARPPPPSPAPQRGSQRRARRPGVPGVRRQRRPAERSTVFPAETQRELRARRR